MTDSKTTAFNPDYDTKETWMEIAAERTAEIERLHAEVISYEKMLTKFEDAFLEQKSKTTAKRRVEAAEDIICGPQPTGQCSCLEPCAAFPDCGPRAVKPSPKHLLIAAKMLTETAPYTHHEKQSAALVSDWLERMARGEV